MININCQGKQFIIDSQTIKKIPVIQKIIDNRHILNSGNDHNIALQLDPKYFQLLINFITIPNFRIPHKIKYNFFNVANMYLLKKPWTNCHKSIVLMDSNKIELTNIYSINDITVTMLREPFQTVDSKKGLLPQKIDVFGYPHIHHTKFFVNDEQLFNNTSNNELTPNISVWKKKKYIVNDTHYDFKGNVVNINSMYGTFSVSRTFLDVLNEHLILINNNTLSLLFDDFKVNHIVYAFVEINYDSLLEL